MINELLPRLEELIPIQDKSDIFYKCGFNVTFEALDFKKKLQIINDIVRQTMIPGYFDIKKYKDEIAGNCYAAALISKEYLRELGIGKNIRCVFARQRKFESNDVLTLHVMLLIDDDLGNTYQYDATPFIGYKFGCVERIDVEKFYQEYVTIDDNLERYLKIFQEIMLKNKLGTIKKDDINFYKTMCFESQKFKILHGYCDAIANILIKYVDYEDEKNLIQMIKSINPYSKYNINNVPKKWKIQIEQIKKWQKELEKLNTLESNDIKKKLELKQYINQEYMMINSIEEPRIFIDGKKVRISRINPRVLYENRKEIEKIKLELNKYINIEDHVNDCFIKKNIYNYCNEYVGLYNKLEEYQIMTRFMYPNPKLERK